MKLEELFSIIKKRQKEMPENSYVVSLLKNPDNMIQKIGEEATEVVIAAKNESQQRIIEESADLLFHLLVLLAEKNITLLDIEKELEKRNKK